MGVEEGYFVKLDLDEYKVIQDVYFDDVEEDKVLNKYLSKRSKEEKESKEWDSRSRKKKKEEELDVTVDDQQERHLDMIKERVMDTADNTK